MPIRGLGIESVTVTTLATVACSAKLRKATAIAAAAMVFLASIAVAAGQGTPPSEPAILPVLAACAFTLQMVAAYMLFAAFARSGTVWFLFVGTAYLVFALLSVPFVLTFPGVFSTSGLFGASLQTAARIGIVRHLAFPLVILAAMTTGRLPRDVQRGRSRLRLIAAAVAACVVPACAVPWLAIALGS